MSRRNSYQQDLVATPWQAALLLATVIFAVIFWGPAVMFSQDFRWREAFVQGIRPWAPWVSVALFIRLIIPR